MTPSSYRDAVAQIINRIDALAKTADADQRTAQIDGRNQAIEAYRGIKSGLNRALQLVEDVKRKHVDSL